MKKELRKEGRRMGQTNEGVSVRWRKGQRNKGRVEEKKGRSKGVRGEKNEREGGKAGEQVGGKAREKKGGRKQGGRKEKREAGRKEVLGLNYSNFHQTRIFRSSNSIKTKFYSR